jgi:hypothetical protein
MPGDDENALPPQQQVDKPRQDLNVSPFLPPIDPDEASQAWEKWCKLFVKKLRFFRVTDLQDKMDALSIYGGEHIDDLTDTLQDPEDGDVNLST